MPENRKNGGVRLAVPGTLKITIKERTAMSSTKTVILLGYSEADMILTDRSSGHSGGTAGILPCAEASGPGGSPQGVSPLGTPP